MPMDGSLVILIAALIVWKPGNGLTLSSSPVPTNDGHLTVCPGTNISLTCSATSVGSLAWRGQDRQIGVFVTRDPVSKVVIEGPYTMTLVDKDSDSMGINFTSTLEVNVDSIGNGTNISCEIFRNQRSLVIRIVPPPATVPTLKKEIIDFYKIHFTFILSWNTSEDEIVTKYRVEVDNFTMVTTNTSIILEGVYNIHLLIKVWAINCAGLAPQATYDVVLSGCDPPSPPVNGSVIEWSSSQVGAQVTYTCDCNTIEIVAICSSLLLWLPGSKEVNCTHLSENDCRSPRVLQDHIIFHEPNGSLTCDEGYHLSETLSSRCVQGEWIIKPDSVVCITTELPLSSTTTLSTAEVITVTVLLCIVCSFTTGMIFGLLLYHCYNQKTRRRKVDTQIKPVYDEVNLENRPPIQLNNNDAYGRINT